MSSPPPLASNETTAPSKPIHTIVLDAGPLLTNSPSISTLLAKSESLLTTPSVISEIRDPVSLSRLQTTHIPFITVRTPKPESIKHVTEFARRTGDLAVLSKADIGIIALGYEVECERNGGDWRLRNVPGQKRLNGRNPNAPPETKDEEVKIGGQTKASDADVGPSAETPDAPPKTVDGEVSTDEQTKASATDAASPTETPRSDLTKNLEDLSIVDQVESSDPGAHGEPEPETTHTDENTTVEAESTPNDEEDDDDDDGGWITPSNLARHQAADSHPSSTPKLTSPPSIMQIAVLTNDFAMQNVTLQMNLNLLSSSLTRISRLNTYILRCHACFALCKEMTRQFCPRCGGATLTRVSCSTNANGEFKVHLKKNFTYNTRGDRYSIPKPVHGSANGRLEKGKGGKGAWGAGLILAEDQKEYVRALGEERRREKKDERDQDWLPGLLTGERRQGGRIRVGAGRNVNSKKR